MVDSDRLRAAYETARCDLLSECEASGHWVGELASSPLSTATAVSALALVERHAAINAEGFFADEVRKAELSELLIRSLRWLIRQQNPDGGWGDTDKSRSNIATTMLVRAAFALTALPSDAPDLLDRADQYIAAHGGIKGLKRRYGRDKTFAAPILTNCALAGLVEWRQVPSLPFELACLSKETWKSLRLPVVSYAIPALVAVGQVRFHFRKPRNPLMRWIRGQAVKKSLEVLETMQPASGGFLEATPLTSFVVMSLAGMGKADHPVVRHGVEFLLNSVRPDGSWPIDSNLATWNTTLAVNALAAGGEEPADLSWVDWLLSCQQQDVHPYTGAAPGGWAWTDLSGGVPDADDTAGALLALAHVDRATRPDVDAAAIDGVRWLLDLQNSDGGWPTFCRGWGKLPFDRSGADLTAHAIRALGTWRRRLAESTPSSIVSDKELATAIERGFRYLNGEQELDGSWEPLWFGNQEHPEEKNFVYGTAKVLLAFRDLGRLDTTAARRGLDWLAAAQLPDGGWGATPMPSVPKPTASTEETALAVETLVTCGRAAAHESAAARGITWLVDIVEAGKHQQTAPVGLYFAKLWYYERLYPLIWSVSALGQAARRHLPHPVPPRTSPLSQR